MSGCSFDLKMLSPEPCCIILILYILVASHNCGVALNSVKAKYIPGKD